MDYFGLASEEVWRPSILEEFHQFHIKNFYLFDFLNLLIKGFDRAERSSVWAGGLGGSAVGGAGLRPQHSEARCSGPDAESS